MVIGFALSSTCKVLAQSISIDSDQVHFIHDISVSADSSGYSIYYSPDSLYIFRKLGFSKPYTYYCDVYALPLSKELTCTSPPDTEFIYYKESIFQKRERQVSNLSAVTKPLTINQYSHNDSALVHQYLKGRKILQMANVDTDNLFVLVRDTATFQCYLIWYNRKIDRAKTYRFTLNTPPPEGVIMLFAHLRDDSNRDLIINQSFPGESSMGTCFSDFYLLNLCDVADLKTTTEDTVYKIIEAIPEVFNFCDKALDKKQTCRIEIASKPDAKHRFYWIQVGIDGKDMFTPIYNFYVYYPDFAVKYYDAANDRTLSLEQWRHLK